MAYRWHCWLALTFLASGVSLGGIGTGWAQTSTPSPSPDDVPIESDPAPTPTDPTTLPPETDPTTTSTEESRFTCQLQNGRYTVMYSPKSQPGQAYPWATPGDLGSAWPAERRCNEISRRLESYRPDGLLELQTGMENGYETVCVTTESVPGCRIVFTVPPGQDAIATRDSVFNNLVLADQGQATQGVSTLTESSNVLEDLLGFPSSQASRQGSINLQPFLDFADGGTGTQLTPTTGRPLNPANF